MSVKFTHECLAEYHDFMVGFAFGIEVGPAFASAHRKSGQTVFENLLEPEELENAQVHSGTETKPAFIRPDGTVELDAVAVIDLNLSLVINPGNLERDDSLRHSDTLKDFILFILGVHIENFAEGLKNFRDTLKELRFPRSRILQVFQHTLCISIHRVFSPYSLN